ncbi:F0F1 ATP synthase subunit epsilon [Waterburya agarophytonicola K14]|uniref:ATP synthase epsilon chain n=1 Tax=Waterburya agarophytonicola KI4 TaxID=2874699 RepID=A0A964BQX3_9CYAN|nr:ATP synthase F1 subunit epsilon [Waterburya agarophytonicola]MCC0177564.1 F0F1 ATP synthase subunit epsilon [Waterburya agarophytonicola KI4]
MALNVKVITPGKTVWDDNVEEIILPSTTGQLGILGGHAPLLTALEVGVMRVRPSKEWKNIAVMGGFAEVENDEIKILVNGAELGDDIDQEAARSAYQEAQTRFQKVENSEDRQEKIQAETSMKKARARFQASGGTV